MAHKIGMFYTGGAVPTRKTATVNTKYLDWWSYPTHRQHTIILELYEHHAT